MEVIYLFFLFGSPKLVTAWFQHQSPSCITPLAVLVLKLVDKGCDDQETEFQVKCCFNSKAHAHIRPAKITQESLLICVPH